MRPSRFRIRTLMIVVAVAGLLFGTAIESRRLRRVTAEYQIKVAKYTELEAIMRRELARTEDDLAWTMKELRSTDKLDSWPASDRFPGTVKSVAHYARFVEYARAMKQKYQHAAAHPWLPVAPDLPEPELDKDK